MRCGTDGDGEKPGEILTGFVGKTFVSSGGSVIRPLFATFARTSPPPGTVALVFVTVSGVGLDSGVAVVELEGGFGLQATSASARAAAEPDEIAVVRTSMTEPPWSW